MPLYTMLDLAPSTRFYSLENCMVILSRQRQLIKKELVHSRQQFIVHDLRRLGLGEAELAIPLGQPLPIPQYNRSPMPWSERIVFRSGRYIVLAVGAAEMPAWLESSFGL
jgi:hypothetical protein